MAKENILTYLETTLEQHLKEFDFAIDWDTKTHRIEVLVALFAENKSLETIEDEEGTMSEEAYIEFEDSLIFYDETHPIEETEDYLTVIPFNRKKGIEKRLIQAVARYLKDVLIEGQADLLEFLNDETIEVFGLNWNKDTFSNYLNEETDHTVVSYPKY